MSSKEKIIAYLKLEKSNKEIAELCNVSVRTVERYKKSLTTNDSDKKSDKRQNDKNKINWVILENEYVTDISDNPITLKGLSGKYDVSFQVLQNYSADNNWSEKRKNYVRNTLEKAQEKLSDKTSDVMTQIINNVNSALLQATEELHIHEEVNGFGQLITIPTNTVRSTKLGRLVKAITSIQKIEIEKQKLELEKAKATREKKQKDKTGSFLDKLEEFL